MAKVVPRPVKPVHLEYRHTDEWGAGGWGMKQCLLGANCGHQDSTGDTLGTILSESS